MRPKLLYIGMQYDYGDRRRGFSYEHRNFHQPLRSYCAKEGWEFLHFDFMERGWEIGQDGMTSELFDLAKKERPDCVFAVLFDFHKDPRHDVFRRISALGAVTVHWFCDDHWRFGNYSSVIAPNFDLVTTTASSSLQKYRGIGMGGRVIKTQWACNHELYVPRDVEKDVAVSFVGQPHGNRAEVLRHLLAAGLDLRVFGFGWSDRPRIPFHQMVRLFSRSRINLNLSNASTSCGEQIKGRNFEIPGTRSFLLTGRADNLEEYYADGKEVVTFETREELADKCRYFLSRDAERNRIAENAYRRTLAEHTWHHRFEPIFREAGMPTGRRARTNPPESVAPRVPKVSVVMPCYNYGKFLPESIPTVIGQSYRDWEIIVVDDGSTDDSLAIARKLEEKHRNWPIRVVSRENGGLVMARDTGVREARGEYVLFFDPDDKLLPDFLEKTVHVLETEPDVGFVYTRYRTFGAFEEFFPQYEYSLKELMEKCIVTASALFRKECWTAAARLDFDRKIVGEDWDFWLSCAEGGWRGRLLKEVLILYRKHGVNRTMAAELNQNPLPYLVLRHPNLYGTGIVNQARRIIGENDPGNLGMPWLAPGRIARRVVSRPDGPKSSGEMPEATGAIRFVNIGMVTYNRLEFTRQAIEALLSNTDFPNVLTVVDNASTDGTREYLRALHARGAIKNLVLLEENVGVAKASNLAWSLEPGADWYLKLDNDIVIRKKDWLAGMVDVAETVSSAAAVAYNFEPCSYPLSERNGCRVRVKAEGNLGGACILIPRRTHDRLGYWCEEYGLYGEEDFDYGTRILISGLLNVYMEDEEVGLHLPAGRAARIDTATWVASDGMEEVSHRDYRRFKDETRRRTVESGFLKRKVETYLENRDMLRIDSVFVRAWERLDQVCPTPESALEAGEICYEAGLRSHARRFFEKALLMDPRNSVALSNLGVLTFQSGDIDRATKYFLDALNIDPENREAAANLAALRTSLETPRGVAAQ